MYALGVTDIASTTELATTSDGLTQLRRHWKVENPRAAMLIVHGIGEHCGRYEHVGAFFADKGIDVLAFDNRGFGQSGGRRAHVERFDDFIADIGDLLTLRRELGVPVILLGHSLGGLMSATYLASNRAQPDFAVLSAPSLTAEVPRWQRIVAPILSKIAPTLFVKSKIDGSVLSRDPLVGEKYVADELVIAGATGRLGNETLVTMKATSAAVNNIKPPLYVLHGDADELVPPSASEALGELDNAERKLWSGLRHECFNEPEQAEVLAATQAWIDTQLAD